MELRDDSFQQGMNAAESSSSKLTDVLKVGLAGAAGAVGAAFVGMAKTGLDNMRAIDDAAKQFQTSTGASAEEAERFSDTLQDLHKVNTDSYEELGDAVTAVRHRHGDLGDEMEGVTQNFLDYAKVTGEDTVDAIEGVTDVQRAWGMELEETEGMMDHFMAIHQETGAEVRNLQQAMAESAPVMDALGMSFEEGAAMLGHFEDMGVDATVASRGLRNAMSRMEAPTDAQAEALQTLGVEVMELEDGVIEINDNAFPELIERLSEGEMSSQEMDAALTLLGRRAGTDMVRALQDGEAGMEEMMAVIEDSEGTVASASEQYDKQLGERWHLIRRQYLEPFMETIGEVLIGVLESALDFLETWGPHVQAVFATISDLVSAVFSAMSDDTDNTFGQIYATISTIIKQVLEVIRMVFGQISAFWDDWGETITGVVITVFDVIGAVIQGALDIISGLLDVFVGVATGDFEQIKEGALSIWQALWTTVESIITGVVDIVVGIIEGFVGDIRGHFVRLREAVIEIVQGIRESITGVFGGMADGVRETVGGMVDGITGIFSRGKEDVTEETEEMTDNVENESRGLLGRLVGNSIYPDMMDGIIGEFERMGQGIRRQTQRAFSDVLTGSKSFSAAVEDTIGSMVDNVMNRLASMATDALFQAVLAGATGGVGGPALGLVSGLLGFRQGLDAGPIPGPRGEERLVAARAGEVVAWPSQIAGIATRVAQMAGGGQRKADITVMLDGEVIARAVEQPLADRIRIKGGIRF